MKFLSLPFATLLQVAVLPAVLSAAVAKHGSLEAAETVNFQGRQLHIATGPIASGSSIVTANSKARSTESSLTKRAVYNACFDGAVGTCADGLSVSPDPPLQADCTALATAIRALAQSQVTTTFPCNFYGSSQCPSFSVPPQYERTYTIGTCQVAFVNLRAIGGDNVQYCDYLIAGTMPGMFNRCVADQGFTGSYNLASDPAARFYALVLRHS